MSKNTKFGMFGGVFTPSILTILGVIMYLRLGWVVGNAGLWGTIIIILIAHVISVSTGLSISSIATDKKIKAGGVYYVLSRSLGLPMGGAIGITLFLGTALSISLYLVGFSESFNAYFGLGDTIDSYRITGTISLLCITIIAFISTSIAIKTQYFILAAIGLSLFSIFLGSSNYLPETVSNFGGIDSAPLETVFAIFFPAVTGFTAGIAMSGDLKDPKKSIPVGTLLAISVGLIVYLVLAFFIAISVDSTTLLTDNGILLKIALYAPLVIAGIWGATLSSALGGILGGPRILQALSTDKVTPKIFAKGVGKGNEPRNALILTFILAEAGVLIGELDVIARVVSMFYLAAYGFINLAAFLEKWASSDFLPSFKVPKAISVIGFVATFAVMFKLDMIAMIAAFIVIGGIFLFLTRKQIALGSGDVWRSVWSSVVKTGLKKMDETETHKRNWKPNILLFSGNPEARPHLIEFSRSLAGRLGMISNFELTENRDTKDLFPKPQASVKDKVFEKHGIFAKKIECNNIYKAVEHIASTYGFSGIEPNSVLMGWAKNSADPKWFAQMTQKLIKLDYNVLFLDYDEARGFGQRKQIDIWWRDINNNAEFALNVVRFLSTSDEWRHASIRILLVNQTSFAKEHLRQSVETLVDQFRINCEVVVIDNPPHGKPYYEIIKAYSIESDLIVVGVPLIKEGEEGLFIETTNNLVATLGTTLLIRASSNFEDFAPDRKLVPQLSHQTDIPSLPNQLKIKVPELTLPSQQNLASEIINFDNLLNKVNDIFFDESLSIILNSCRSIIEKIKENSSNTAVSLKKLTKFSSINAQKELITSNHDLLLKISIETLEEFQKNHIEFLQNELVKGIDIFLKNTNNISLSCPKTLIRSISYEDIIENKNDNKELKQLKKRKRRRTKILGSAGKVRIDFRYLTANHINDQFLVNFQKFLTDYGFFEYYLIEQIKSAYNAISIPYSQALAKLEKESINEEDIDDIVNTVEDTFSRLSYWINTEYSKSIQQLKIKNRKVSNKLSSNVLDLMIVDKLDEWHIPAKKIRKQISVIQSFPANLSKNRNLYLGNLVSELEIQRAVLQVKLLIQRVQSEVRLVAFTGLKFSIKQLVGETDKIKNLIKEESSLDDYNFEAFEKINEPFFLSDHILNDAIEELGKIVENISEHAVLVDNKAIREMMKENSFTSLSTTNVALSKITYYIVENYLIAPTQKLLRELPGSLRKITGKVQSNANLILFNFNTAMEDSAFKDTPETILDNVTTGLTEATNQLELVATKTYGKIQEKLDETLKHLTTDIITQEFQHMELYINREQKIKGLRVWLNRIKADFNKRLLSIEKIITLKKQSLIQNEFINANKKNANIHALISDFVEAKSIKQSLEAKIPFFYKQLYLGKHPSSYDNYENRTWEINQINNAINRLNTGGSGGILLIGEYLSGKTYLAEHVAKNVLGKKPFIISPPPGGSSDVNIFFQIFQEALGQHGSPPHILRSLQQKSVIILDDIELWWEKRESGDEVLKKIGQLIDGFGSDQFFIVSCNTHSFEILKTLFNFDQNFITTVQLSPLDQTEIRNIIQKRHRLSGFGLQLNGKAETDLSRIQLNKLFKKYQVISQGNIGASLLLWLSSIKNIENETIFINAPIELDFPEIHNSDWYLILTQFIYHKQITLDKLARIFKYEKVSFLKSILLGLERAQLIERISADAFKISPYTIQGLVKHLKELKLLN